MTNASFTSVLRIYTRSCTWI